MSKYGRSYQPDHHHYIQNKLVDAIQDPSFKLVLPELRPSTWQRVLFPASRQHDNNRELLEFLGDALMNASVALELYKLFPHSGTPHLFTILRSALNTNRTFTQYMVKVGAWGQIQEFPSMADDAFDKVAADAFETLMAAYYLENGFVALCTWVSTALGPLIIIAGKASDEFLARHPRPKRRSMGQNLFYYPPAKRYKVSEITHVRGNYHRPHVPLLSHNESVLVARSNDINNAGSSYSGLVPSDDDRTVAYLKPCMSDELPTPAVSPVAALVQFSASGASFAAKNQRPCPASWDRPHSWNRPLSWDRPINRN